MVAATPPPVAHVAIATRFSLAVVRQINSARATRGLPRLIRTDRLRRVATHHTLDMLRSVSFSHDGDGTTFARRIRKRTRYDEVGETLALFPGDDVGARRVVRAWLRSPGHRAVLLDGSFRRIGVGTVLGPFGPRLSTVVTADFGTWR